MQNFAHQRKAKHPYSFRIRRDINHEICAPELDGAQVYPVKVFSPSGRLKKTISVKAIKARPMEEGIYEI